MTRPGELTGRLRERVTIERREAGRDAIGGATGEWRAVGDAWAAIEPDGKSALVEADAIRARVRWAVTLRSGADLIIDDRIIWRGTPLRVRSVTRDPRTPDRIDAEAEEEA